MDQIVVKANSCLTQAKQPYRWLILVPVLLTTAIGIMIFAAPFPLLNLWVRELGISRAQAGSLTGMWYLASTLVALPSGSLADRVPLRRLFLSLWALIVVGSVLMASAQGFWMLCLGRIVFSGGMGGHLVAAPKLLATWFEGRKEFGLIMGFYSMSITGGVYASLSVLGRVGERSGWRSAMLLTVMLATAGLLLMLCVRSQPQNSCKQSAAIRFPLFQFGLAAWVFAAAYGGYNVATDAYLTYGPDYLVQRGYGLAAASAIVGIYAWVALGLKPFLSFFLRKNNAAVYVSIASVLFIFSVGLLIIGSAPPAVSSSVFGISMALAMPALYAVPPLIFGVESSGRVYGLCQFFYGLGFLIQPLIGLTIDKTGNYMAGYAVMCVTAGFPLFGCLWLIRYAGIKSRAATVA